MEIHLEKNLFQPKIQEITQETFSATFQKKRKVMKKIIMTWKKREY